MKKIVKFCIVIIVILLLVKIVLGIVESDQTGSGALDSLVEKLTGGDIDIDLQGIQKELESTLNKNALYDIDESNMFDEKYEIREGSVDKAQVADAGIKELDIELGGCLFELKSSEDTSYYMEYDGQGKTQVYVEENELFVKVLNGKEWNVNTDKDGVTLYIPKEAVLDEVEIDLGAGQMSLDHLKASAIEINLGAGQVRADQIQAEKASLTVGAGEIVLEDVQMKDVQAEVGAGNCEIDGIVTGNIEADCAMGNITFGLEGSVKDFNYEIMCVTGNITIDGEKYSGLTKEQTIHNNADKNMELDCAMGNIRVEF